MDKRLLLVLPLCLAILVGWQLLVVGRRPQPAAQPASVTAGAQPGVANQGGANPSGGSGTAPATDAPKAAAPLPGTRPAMSAIVADTEERRVTLVLGRRGSPGFYQAVFSNKGGVLEELRTGNYFDRAGLSAAEQADVAHWTRLVALPDSGADAPTRAFTLRTAASSAEFARGPIEDEFWTLRELEENGARNGVEFTLAPGQGVTFVKRFRFLPDTDQLRFEFEIRNDSRPESLSLRNFVLTPAAGVPNDTGDTFYLEPVAVAYSRAGGEDKLAIGNVQPKGDVKTGVLATGAQLSFAGVFNKYFAVVLHGSDESSKATLVGASWRAVRDVGWLRANPGNAALEWRQIETDIDLQVQLPAQGTSRTWSYDVYAGPKVRTAIDAAYADHAVLLDHDLGYMRGLSKVLIWVLRGFHALTTSWGVAIVLLTIAVRTLLFPINRRAQTAMARYQAKIKRIQPRIDEIKKKYEKDPSKLRQEQARIMQEEEALVPPLGGCLPPLLQIPVFFGLLSAIRVPIDLRQAPFMGWIHDLSLPDRLLRLDWTLPIVGHVPYLNVLPPLMVVVWILQQRSMPMPSDEQGRTMYKMMMFMPLVMGIFLYNYAAGLSLYMITQSGLAILEQKVIRKYWPVDDKPLPKKKKSGFMARLMEQAQAQQKLQEQARQKKASARR